MSSNNVRSDRVVRRLTQGSIGIDIYIYIMVMRLHRGLDTLSINDLSKIYYAYRYTYI